METIKNYLESMFAKLPNTPEVRKAKDELWQMMEDKYNELVADGMSDNAAVGTVISEFGNLDELAEDLGINNVVEASETEERREITLEDAKEYLLASRKQSFQIALGVAFCIMCIVPACMFDAFGLNDNIGAAFMFPMIAVGVVLFIYSSVNMKKWEYLQREACSMDFATADYVKKEEAQYVPKNALWLAIGVALCVISFVPAALLDEITIGSGNVDYGDLSGALLFIFVAVGVFMIVNTSNTKAGFETLFKACARKRIGGSPYIDGSDGDLSETGTGSGNVYTYTDGDKTYRYISPAAETIMDVFWPTVTCIYLCWSFLTFDWWITWIIWPIAGVLHAALKSMLTQRL
ncbi:MAG: hypothetical protein IJ661_00095 [Lachnospiraceae bacterium]|nr:hypothetical protein [Lachnospiraceae bacterium]